MDTQPKEEKEIEPSQPTHETIIAVGCNQHEYKEDFFDERSGWQHVQCGNCSHGRFYDPKVSKFEGGEICPLNP